MIPIPSLFKLAGGPRGYKDYILYPSDDRIHSTNYPLDTVARYLLNVQSVDDPIETLLKQHYAIIKVENNGSTLPFYKAVYEIFIKLNRQDIHDNRLAFRNIIAFYKVLDKAARGALLPFYAELYDFSEEPSKRIHLHGYGARSLALHLGSYASPGLQTTD